jgi:AhpD family alkylhydroperoxidase
MNCCGHVLTCIKVSRRHSHQSVVGSFAVGCSDEELAREYQRAHRPVAKPARRRARGHEGIWRHCQAALAGKALDGKTKELIALGIAVAVRCDDCIGFHVNAALEQGASRDEVLDTLGMAIYMGAGPSVMYASHALEAFGQFQNQGAKASSAD